RRAHPVQRLVAAAVGVHEQAAVALVHEQTRGEGEMGVEPAGVVHGAAGDDETHDAEPTRRGRRTTPQAAGVFSGTASGFAAAENTPDISTSTTRMNSVFSRPM